MITDAVPANPVGRVFRSLRRRAALMREDVDTVLARDPSVHSRAEALLAPHLVAIWAYRLSHALYMSGRRVPAGCVGRLGRLISGGIEIHPGARIGRRFFVDHGCGTVIGETAVIGDDVTLYHQVTLGAVGWWRDNRRQPGERRHPLLGCRVVVGAGAVILGPVRVGDDARIGSKSLVTDDVAAGAVLSTERTTPAVPTRPIRRTEYVRPDQ
ncbi:MAG TPA: serine acetyltransferase [Pseudonocardiaceae bacterium]|nr:serine acetyltransferase [Pseudonocardiaceae bacterium]